MSGIDDATAPGEDAADRIEEALERIAILAARMHPAAAVAGGTIEAGGADATLALRLDAVIARLRQALGN